MARGAATRSAPAACASSKPRPRPQAGIAIPVQRRQATSARCLREGRASAARISQRPDQRLRRAQITGCSAPARAARLAIDGGAARAVLGGASLLPGSIVSVDSELARGDLVHRQAEGNVATCRQPNVITRKAGRSTASARSGTTRDIRSDPRFGYTATRWSATDDLVTHSREPSRAGIPSRELARSCAEAATTCGVVRRGQQAALRL